MQQWVASCWIDSLHSHTIYFCPQCNLLLHCWQKYCVWIKSIVMLKCYIKTSNNGTQHTFNKLHHLNWLFNVKHSKKIIQMNSEVVWAAEAVATALSNSIYFQSIKLFWQMRPMRHTDQESQCSENVLELRLRSRKYGKLWNSGLSWI